MQTLFAFTLVSKHLGLPAHPREERGRQQQPPPGLRLQLRQIPACCTLTSPGVLSAAVLASWQLVPRPRSTHSCAQKCLPFQLPCFSISGGPVQPRFWDLCTGDFLFYSQEAARVSCHPPWCCPSKLTALSAVCWCCSSSVYFRLKKASGVDTEISLYLNSPTGRSLFLDYSCRNAGNSPIWKYTVTLGQSLLF